MSGITTSLLSLAWSLWNWLILDYEEANGQTVRPWAPFLLSLGLMAVSSSSWFLTATSDKKKRKKDPMLTNHDFGFTARPKRWNRRAREEKHEMNPISTHQSSVKSFVEMSPMRCWSSCNVERLAMKRLIGSWLRFIIFLLSLSLPWFTSLKR